MTWYCMVKKFFPFVSLILIYSAAYSQKVLVNVFMEEKVAKPTGDTIYHDVNKPLAWKDFKEYPIRSIMEAR